MGKQGASLAQTLAQDAPLRNTISLARSNGRLIHVVVQELNKLHQHKSVAFTGHDSVGSDQLGANEPGTGQIA